RLLPGRVIVMLLREGIERRTRTPQLRDGVGLGVRAGEVRRVELRANENVPRFHLTGIDAINANDVIPERTLEHGAQLTRRQRPDPPLELRDVLTAARPTEIAACLLGRRIHRLALRE